jgi:hypothetical protein
MKVLVCGSRGWKDAVLIEAVLKTLPRGSEIISGGARGADQLAATIGRRLGFTVTEFPVDWKKDGVYNPRAGLDRNDLMLDQQPDKVIAFWTGGSTGTGYTVGAARLRSIPVDIVTPAER